MKTILSLLLLAALSANATDRHHYGNHRCDARCPVATVTRTVTVVVTNYVLVPTTCPVPGVKAYQSELLAGHNYAVQWKLTNSVSKTADDAWLKWRTVGVIRNATNGPVTITVPHLGTPPMLQVLDITCGARVPVLVEPLGCDPASASYIVWGRLRKLKR